MTFGAVPAGQCGTGPNAVACDGPIDPYAAALMLGNTYTVYQAPTYRPPVTCSSYVPYSVTCQCYPMPQGSDPLGAQSHERA
jgi:hypothetical protein